jgi:3-oxoacyl-[acyl-carrier protein] reductase
MGNLNGKVAIVTGASKGIGTAITKGLAAAGAAVAVNYTSDKEGADRAVAEILAWGGEAIAVRSDMSKAADVKRLFKETKRLLGAPTVLVNNAGTYKFEPIEDITEAEFHRHFDINVLGPMLAIQEALNYFPAEGGSIVNISSIASESPVPNSSLYSATKGALDALTLALARELRSRKIRVNAVTPGYTETEGTQRIWLGGSAEEEAMVAATPLGGRFGRPEEIAPVVIFLASDDAAWLTGEKIDEPGIDALYLISALGDNG